LVKVKGKAVPEQ